MIIAESSDVQQALASVPEPAANGTAPPTEAEAWEALDLHEQLAFILDRVHRSRWFDDEYLQVLIAHCHSAIIWAQIKARFQHIGGNAFDLEQVAKEVRASLKQTRLAQAAARQGADQGDPAPPVSEGGLKLRSTDGSRIAAHLAQDYRDTLALSLEDHRWYRYQPASGVWRPEPLLKVRAQLRKSIATLEPGATYAWSLASDVEKFLQTYLYRDFPRVSGHRIPFTNGALNLQTKTLEDHAPAHGFRWALPYAYVPDAPCDQVKQWLADFVHGDAQMVQILRAYARAVVCGRADLRRFLALVGSSGSGKSTYVRFLQALVGMENTVATEIRQLETNRFELSGLIGKRLITLTDVGHYVGEVNTLKAITGGDVLRVETKHVDRKETPSAFCEGMVVVVSEHAVQSTDYSAGLEARRISIPTRARVGRPVNMLDYDHERGLFSGRLVPDLPGVFPWLFQMTDREMEDTLRYAVHQHPSLRKAQVEAILETNPLMRWADATLALWTPEERQAYADKTPKAPPPLQIGVARKCDKGVNAYECETVWLYPSFRRYADDTNSASLSQQRFTGLLVNLLVEQLQLSGVARLPHGKHGSRLCGLRFRTLSDNAENTTTPRLSEGYTALDSSEGGPGAEGSRLGTAGADRSRQGADFPRIEDDGDGLYALNGNIATRAPVLSCAHMSESCPPENLKSPSPSSSAPRNAAPSPSPSAPVTQKSAPPPSLGASLERSEGLREGRGASDVGGATERAASAPANAPPDGQTPLSTTELQIPEGSSRIGSTDVREEPPQFCPGCGIGNERDTRTTWLMRPGYWECCKRQCGYKVVQAVQR